MVTAEEGTYILDPASQTKYPIPLLKSQDFEVEGYNPFLREQMAVMMYRYAKEFKGYDVSGNAYYIRFTDAPSVSEYAKEAMAWAVGKGIITGKDLD